jgi:peptide-methionine (S)-S-oxide reductase
MTDTNTEGTVEQTTTERTLQKATFGAGCFWGVEVAFRNTPGVTNALVGYEGGRLENPSYREVCSHTTGHAEVVEVTYDPAEVSYDQLLDVFWDEHDPTQLNRQGPDIGDQYRSVVFFHTPQQEKEAIASRDRLQASGKYRRPIVTVIEPAQTFYKAEEYHQRYLEKHGMATCRI